MFDAIHKYTSFFEVSHSLQGKVEVLDGSESTRFVCEQEKRGQVS